MTIVSKAHTLAKRQELDSTIGKQGQMHKGPLVESINETVMDLQKKQRHCLLRAWREISKFWHIAWVLTHWQIQNDHRSRILGTLWTLLDPLIRVCIFTVVVTVIFNKNVPAYPVFMFCGSIFFRLLSGIWAASAGTLVNYGNIIKGTPFPKIIVPVIYTLSRLYYALLELPVLVILMALFGIYPSWHFLLALPWMLMTALCGFGLVCLFCTFGVKYRDLINILGHFSQLFFYLSPVLYPISFIPERVRMEYLVLNPFAQVMEVGRDLIIRNQLPVGWMVLLFSSLTTMTVYIGLRVFYARQRFVIKYL